MKTKDLVNEIEKLKGKVVVDNNIKNLWDQVSRLSENLVKLMESNEKLSSQFIVVKKVNTLLEKRVIELEKSQAKAEQYSRRNNVEISGIPHEILDNNLEDKVIDICKDAGIEIGHMDIEGCHWLPLSRNNAGGTKRVIVKFVNRKHSEDMLRLKKIVSSHSKVFISNSLCPYHRYLWGKCKDLQRTGIFNQVFCLGAVVTLKVSKNGKNHENDLKIYQGDGNASDSEWIRASFFFKCLLTTTFLARVCAAHKPVNFINLLFLRCTVPFSIKEVCALSLIPSFIVLLMKGCLGLLQYVLHCLCGRFIDFQPFGFYGSLGQASGFLRCFFPYCQHLW